MIDDKKIEEAAINKCGFISSEFIVVLNGCKKSS